MAAHKTQKAKPKKSTPERSEARTERARGRPRIADELHTAAIRIPIELHERIEVVAAALSPDLPVSKSDMIRRLIEEGLIVFERRLAKKRAK